MAVTRAQVEEQLRRLSPEQLNAVYDFVSFLAERRASRSLTTMLASESVLSRDWNRPEEDAPWSDV